MEPPPPSSLVSPSRRTTEDFSEVRNLDFVDFSEATDLSPGDGTLLDWPSTPPTHKIQKF